MQKTPSRTDKVSLNYYDAEFWHNIDRLKRRLLLLAEANSDGSSSGKFLPKKLSGIQRNDSTTQNPVIKFPDPQSLDLLKRIEGILERCIQQQSSDMNPEIYVPNRKTWKNTSFHIQQGFRMKSEPTVSLLKKSNASVTNKRFGLTLHLLSKIHFLIKTNKYSTKRELYYEDVQLYKNQTVVDNILDDIACMLGTQKINLHVLTTSKGQVAGHLFFRDADGTYVDCSNTNQGLLLPNDINAVNSIHSEARFILVVEKDAIFQKIIESDAMRKLYPCIVITGKGFPDVNTRQMLCKLWDCLHIPVMALVDADPYGKDIYY